jgi:gliding motility-associated lipoprotein GldH
MKIQFILLGLVLMLSSCNSNSIYSESDSFTNNQWHKNSNQTYVFNVEDDSQLYDVTFILSHVYDYQFASAPLSFKWIKPDGTSEIIPLEFLFKDDKGKEIGDCSGDICDLTQLVLSKIKLPKGENQIEVTHSFQFDYMPNIIQIGLDVSVSK